MSEGGGRRGEQGERGREGGRKGGRERGRKGGRERGRAGGREGSVEQGGLGAGAGTQLACQGGHQGFQHTGRMSDSFDTLLLFTT